ncbi:MAG: hypothetical protein UR99_C0046G0007 [Candidatus Moranbacteria bacterium GW2011_GWD2_36_12]|nr:MAG: hypothetical protein UR99_C0046G0007 [Candidatus Moranbacteria bacterium GW2011_GWD2_36_12]KKQ04887.1 MAG: hypothetical protein US16_C0043G0007 [Candidatus Moranbacteria bacterium GW2011_GWE2_36_40]
MSSRGIKLYLEDIRESIKKIEKYTRGMDFTEFSRDMKTVDAVIKNLFVIGEAANNIPKEIKLKYPEVSWREISGMRNKIAHEYFGIDEEILWKTIKEDLPIFKKQISKI